MTTNNALEALSRMQCIIEQHTDGGTYEDYNLIRTALLDAQNNPTIRPVDLDALKKMFETWFFKHRKDCRNHKIILDENDANSMWEGWQAAFKESGLLGSIPEGMILIRVDTTPEKDGVTTVPIDGLDGVYAKVKTTQQNTEIQAVIVDEQAQEG